MYHGLCDRSALQTYVRLVRAVLPCPKHHVMDFRCAAQRHLWTLI